MRFLVKVFGDEHFAGAVCDTFRFRKIKPAAGQTARHGHGFSRIYDSLAAEFCQKPKANLLVDSDCRSTKGEHERASSLSNSKIVAVAGALASPSTSLSKGILGQVRGWSHDQPRKFDGSRIGVINPPVEPEVEKKPLSQKAWSHMANVAPLGRTTYQSCTSTNRTQFESPERGFAKQSV